MFMIMSYVGFLVMLRLSLHARLSGNFYIIPSTLIYFSQDLAGNLALSQPYNTQPAPSTPIDSEQLLRPLRRCGEPLVV